MSERIEHMDARRGRSWNWAAVIVEIIGLAIDALWHGVLGGEIWHAHSHLRSWPNPLPELTGFVGLAVAIAATVASARSARGIAMEPRRAHRSP